MSAVVSEFRTQGTAEFRKPVLTLVEVSWQNSDGSLQTVPARMEDKSPGGACIRIEMPVAVGTTLKIQSRHENFFGTVRYCRAEHGEYLVGIQRDAANNPLPDQPVPNQVPSQKGAPLPSTIMVQTIEAPIVEVPIASVLTVDAPAAIVSTVNIQTPPKQPEPERRVELQTKQPPKQADEGRKRMRDKWLELPWNKKHDGLNAGGPKNGDDSNGNRAKENPMHDLTYPAPKTPARSAREVPTFQVDLSPMEDIYRAAGIMDPRKGYSITKVVEMLHSAHIRDLSKEMRQAAVLMALETAGISIEQVQRDAKARQDALDSHEALQRKHVEAEWARKAEEIVQIQAELESIKAHYMARISQNMEGVAREKETFASWLTSKQQECQSMADAVELCMKSPASAPASAPSDVSMSLGMSVSMNSVQASAKTV